jgi:hypothetical protein
MPGLQEKIAAGGWPAAVSRPAKDSTTILRWINLAFAAVA